MLALLILAALGGTAAVYLSSKKEDSLTNSATSGPGPAGSGIPSLNVTPSGKQWPGGITTEDVNRAVTFALKNEITASGLRAFAGMMERYDDSSSNALLAKANKIDPEGARTKHRRLGNVGISTTRAGRLT